MKHQITLLGGQISPVYWGILEYNLDVVHILYTKESKKILTKLKRLINISKLYTYQVDPNDFISTLEIVTDIFSKNKKHEFNLNLTGGTKLMALAGQNACQEFGVNYFYIDQKHVLFEMPSLAKRKLLAKTTIKTALKMAGSKSTRFSNPSSVYNKSDFNLSEFIHLNLHKREFRKLQSALVKMYNNEQRIRNLKVENTELLFTKRISYKVEKKLFDFNKTTSSELIIGRGLWWEILISQSMKSLNANYSHFMNVEFISETNNVLNEIDILLFDNRTLHFIEAKSGRVTQNDINKITTVRKLYGSVLSHSFLISRYKLRPDLLEKCLNLGIHVLVYGKAINAKGFSAFQNISELPKLIRARLNQRRI